MVNQKTLRSWKVAFAACLGPALLLGGCRTNKGGQFGAYDLHNQVHWDEVLLARVVFLKVTKVEIFELQSYEVASPQGAKYPIAGLTTALPKGGGRSWRFEVNGAQIPKETKEIQCRFNFRFGGENRFTLTSRFIRNGTAGREWRADEGQLKLEIRKE